MQAVIPVGFDPGNGQTQIVLTVTINGKLKTIKASIPSAYASKLPPGQISPKNGTRMKPVAFSLILDNKSLYFDRDVLGTSTTREIDMAKYEPFHLCILFRAALYKACRSAKIDIKTLGRLRIVASMPPGLWEDERKRKTAAKAFDTAFNRGQSHLWIRDGKNSSQIVTEFVALQQEAVSWSQTQKQKANYSLTVDLGAGTNDYALFVNGAKTARKTWTDNNGLLHVFEEIDRVNPEAVELEILRDKENLPDDVLFAYNQTKRTIQKITLRLPGSEIGELNIIGGGAELMTKKVRDTFLPLADKVNILGEYANAEASHEASKAGQ